MICAFDERVTAILRKAREMSDTRMREEDEEEGGVELGDTDNEGEVDSEEDSEDDSDDSDDSGDDDVIGTVRAHSRTLLRGCHSDAACAGR